MGLGGDCQQNGTQFQTGEDVYQQNGTKFKTGKGIYHQKGAQFQTEEGESASKMVLNSKLGMGIGKTASKMVLNSKLEKGGLPANGT